VQGKFGDFRAGRRNSRKKKQKKQQGRHICRPYKRRRRNSVPQQCWGLHKKKQKKQQRRPVERLLFMACLCQTRPRARLDQEEPFKFWPEWFDLKQAGGWPCGSVSCWSTTGCGGGKEGRKKGVLGFSGMLVALKSVSYCGDVNIKGETVSSCSLVVRSESGEVRNSRWDARSTEENG
jgi:hypothetical protein